MPMGVIKNRRQGPRKNICVHQFPVNHTEDELVQEDRFLSGEDHDNDPDDSNLSDAGCEYALVYDQISNIPYELYELANLKDILCLETWNLCLTEEERFALAAYLPDMDLETFELTMIELLSGDNLYFGSPLEILFHRLKGGFYSLQVTPLREGLKFLQERGYFHYLRSYHESMSQKFMEMRKAWSNSQPYTSVEERVQIWKDKKNQRPAFLVDLNAFPFDEELPSKSEKKVKGLPPRKKTTFIDEEVNTHVPSMDWNSTALFSRRRAMGVLKIKPPKESSRPKQIVESLPSETWEPFRRLPKGVLKVKPKGYPTNLLERPRVNAVPHGQSSGSVFGVHASRLSPSHSASQWQEKKITKKLNFVHQFVGSGSVYRGSPISELDNLNIGSRLSDNAQSSLRKMKTSKGLRMSSNDSSGFVECFDSQQNGALCPTSSVLFQPTFNNNRRKLIPLHTNVSEAISRNLITTDDYEMFPTSNDHSENQLRDKNDGEVVEKSHRFPLTYKRKKPHKLRVLQNQIKPSMVAGIAPAFPVGTNFNQVEKTKAIRIRVKGWNDFSSQHKQGVLDGIFTLSMVLEMPMSKGIFDKLHPDGFSRPLEGNRVKETKAFAPN